MTTPNRAFHCHKVCLTGQAGVGKTSTFMRIKTGRFRVWSTTNLHTDTYEMTRLVNGEDISVSCAASTKYRMLNIDCINNETFSNVHDNECIHIMHSF